MARNPNGQNKPSRGYEAKKTCVTCDHAQWLANRPESEIVDANETLVERQISGNRQTDPNADPMQMIPFWCSQWVRTRKPIPGPAQIISYSSGLPLIACRVESPKASRQIDPCVHILKGE